MIVTTNWGVRMAHRWPMVLAAAAVLIVMTAVGLGVRMLDDADSSTTPGSPTVGSLPAPEPGHRWVSWRDVAVQVPTTWPHGAEPGEDWCASDETAAPPKPYVALNPGYGGVLAIGCIEPPDQHDPAFGPAPERMWATHVALEQADGTPDQSLTDGEWTLSTRTVGDVRVRLLTDEPDATQDILATATRFQVDHHGCRPSSPIQAAEFVRPDPFDVTEIDAVDRLSTCQYQRGIPLDQPALMASRSVDGAAAEALLEGFQEAPVGGGPDKPANCVDDMFGDTGIAVTLDQGGVGDTVFVYSDWCFGNGSDDGTTRRELTPQTCAPLFGEAVRAWGYSSFMRSRCS